MILGDELIVPQSFRYEVKDLMQRLVFEHAEFKRSIKVTTREGEESFPYESETPSASEPSPIVNGQGPSVGRPNFNVKLEEGDWTRWPTCG